MADLISKYCIFILLTSIVTFAQSQTLRGKVIGISDGDTFRLLVGTKTYKIRLNGIDCPEMKQSYGMRAKQYTSNLIYRKYVRAEKRDMDRYGRFVCDVYIPDSTNVNEELVKNGYAWHFKKYSKDKRLAELEIQARENKLGLWADPNPIPPWEFRHNKKSLL